MSKVFITGTRASHGDVEVPRPERPGPPITDVRLVDHVSAPLLVALGDAGLSVRESNGEERRHIASPVHWLVETEEPLVYLGVRPANERFEVSIVDIESGVVRPWKTLAIEAASRRVRHGAWCVVKRDAQGLTVSGIPLEPPSRWQRHFSKGPPWTTRFSDDARDRVLRIDELGDECSILYGGVALGSASATPRIIGDMVVRLRVRDGAIVHRSHGRRDTDVCAAVDGIDPHGMARGRRGTLRDPQGWIAVETTGSGVVLGTRAVGRTLPRRAVNRVVFDGARWVRADAYAGWLAAGDDLGRVVVRDPEGNTWSWTIR